MATRLYLTNGESPVASASISYSGWGLPATAPAANKLARAGNWPGTTAFNNATGSENDSSRRIVCIRRFLSDPLVGDQAISGTVIGQMRMSQSAAGMNALATVEIKVVSGAGTVVRGTLFLNELRTTTPAGEELSTTLRNQSNPSSGVSPGTLSGISALAGDRILVEIGIRANNTSTTNFTATMRHGSLETPGGANDYTVGGTETTDLNPWVEFSQDLDFEAPSQVTGLAATPGIRPSLTWNTATDDVGVVAYHIVRDSGSGFVQQAVVSGLTWQEPSDLEPNTTYNYQVRARDAAGNFGIFSTTVTATTPQPITRLNTATAVATGGTDIIVAPDTRKRTVSVAAVGGANLDVATLRKIMRTATVVTADGVQVTPALRKLIRTGASAALGGTSLDAVEYLDKLTAAALTGGGVDLSAAAIQRKRQQIAVDLGGVGLTQSADIEQRSVSADILTGGLTMMIGQMVKRLVSGAVVSGGGVAPNAQQVNKRLYSGATFDLLGVTATGTPILRKRMGSDVTLGGLLAEATLSVRAVVAQEVFKVLTDVEVEYLLYMDIEQVLLLNQTIELSDEEMRIQMAAEVVLRMLLGVEP